MKMINSKAAFVALMAAASLAACNSADKDSKTADSQNITVDVTEVQQPATPAKTQMPYSAQFFQDSANKAASTSAADSTWVETPSGLKYAVIKEGTGKSPQATDIVTVNYAGQLTDIDATEFDSSYARNEPASFPLNRVIAGWTEGLQLMKEGAVYEFYIPADLAYGPQGSGPIPPNAPLVFQVELLKVGQPDAAQ
ncbi:MAG: FKBP-type peptidyl-prolyl cis-trans isomerase [Muribaculaceae bacterium]|nr:FKBP-type peptidyl-prolyl cis-trans isomerase [Muribaculaceae bacterium]